MARTRPGVGGGEDDTQQPDDAGQQAENVVEDVAQDVQRVVTDAAEATGASEVARAARNVVRAGEETRSSVTGPSGTSEVGTAQEPMAGGEVRAVSRVGGGSGGGQQRRQRRPPGSIGGPGPRSGEAPYSRFGGASEVEAPEDVQQFIADVERATRPGGTSDISFDVGITDQLTSADGEPVPILERFRRDPLAATEEAARSSTTGIPGVPNPNFYRGGFFTEETEAGFRKGAENFGENIPLFPTREELLEGETVEEQGEEGPGERILEGVAVAGHDLLNVPSWVVMGETGVETVGNAPATVEEEGAEETATTAGSVALLAGQELIRSGRERPLRTGSGLLFDIAVGTGAARAVEKAGGATRTFQVARRAAREGGGSVDFADVTSARGLKGELPEFRTDRNAPTRTAVQEVRERARDNPPEATDPVGAEGTLFHSTRAEDFGDEFTVEAGGSELPGLFTSPDASPLRLDQGVSTSLRNLKPRLPRPFSSGDRLVGLPGDEIKGMPEWATGSGRIFDPEADDWIPDPATTGSQFLKEQADPGTAFVRPRGGRTTELEAIFPPGSTFGRSATVRVDMPGGRSIPLETFRRTDVGAAPDAGDVRRAADDIEASDLPTSQITADERTPVFPTLPGSGIGSGGGGTPTDPMEVFGGTTPTRGGGGDGSSVFGGDRTSIFGGGPGNTPFGSPNEPTGGPTGGPSGPSGVPTGPPGTPTGPPSGPPSSPPGSPPPSAPPSSPPSSPPGSPPGAPPSTPPGVPPGIPGFPPNTPGKPPGDPRKDRPEDDERELFPFGTEFDNPVASGFQFLFGDIDIGGG